MEVNVCTVNFIYIASDGCRRMTNSFLPCFLPIKESTKYNSRVQYKQTFKLKFGYLNEIIQGSNNKINQVLRRKLVNYSQKRLQEQT